MAKKSPFIFLLIAIALLAFGYGLWTRHNFSKKEIPIADALQLASGTVLPQPRDIIPFQLIDKNNHPFTSQNFQNRWSFVFFGFTRCPMVCPTTLSNLKQMYQQLLHQQLQPLPQIVFISVDPEHDTPAQLNSYLQSYDAEFQGASGNKQQLDALAKQFNATFSKIFPHGSDQDYSIEHSGTILLVSPKGQLYAVFTAPHDPKKMANDFRKIVSQYAAKHP